jgi:hypothetical protein
MYVKINVHLLTCICCPHDELPEQLCFDLSSAPVNHEWVSEIVEAAEEHDLALLLSGKQQRPVSPRMSSSSNEEDVKDVGG